MPATTASQWRLMKGLCDGSVKERKGLPSKAEACEFIKDQPSPEGLPEGGSREHLREGVAKKSK